MRVIAILAAYNEERFIGGCLEHLSRQGVEAYLIDNGSTDRTVEIAERFRGRGLLEVEHFPRASGKYEWQRILERKEELAAELDADWFLHQDPDEVRLPPRADVTLAEAFADADRDGWNAVDFLEFVFVPTREEPDHDHERHQETMRWYYAFQPSFPHRLTAWRKQPQRVELAWSGGHVVRFPNLRMSPVAFPMRHYLFLSVPHLAGKYGGMRYETTELRRGWHGWRSRLRPDLVRLPSQTSLRAYTSDAELDPSDPRKEHVTEAWSRKGWRRWF